MKKNMNVYKLSCLAVWFLLIPIAMVKGKTVVKPAMDSVCVYSYPNVILNSSEGCLKQSDVYHVKVLQQGKSSDVYVLQDANTNQLDASNRVARLMTNNNHTAEFSFSGRIQVVISRKDGKTMNGSLVYPKVKKYDYTYKGKNLIINLSSWAYIYVETPDLNKNPLFIFADSIETDVPSKLNSEVLEPTMGIEELKYRIKTTKNDVIYFDKGIYLFGDKKGTDYEGFKIPLLSNKKYYVPGGAVIVGSFSNEGAVSHCKLYGRGIITGCGLGRLAGASSIPYNLYNTGVGHDNIIEGLQFNNPPHFCILSRGELKTQFTKMFGWYYQTDGWGGGDHSELRNCFIKVNDDFIKIYKDNMSVNNVIMYKQINGAGIQLGWNSYGSAKNCKIENIYIVKEDEKVPNLLSNTAVINMISNGGGTISGLLFKNIYVENTIQRFLGLCGSHGSVNDLRFENVYLPVNMFGCGNYVATYDDTQFRNFSFTDVFVGGMKLLRDADFDFRQYLVKDKRCITDGHYHLVDILYR